MVNLTRSPSARFVEKAGPVFRFQDAAEKIITWENPLVTMLVGAVYAFLCASLT